MAFKKPTTITSWSFSRYSVYVLCALKAKFQFVDKIKEPSNDAMARGDDIHKKAEGYLKGTIARLPAELKLIETTLKALRAQAKKKVLGVIVEESWCFDKDWQPVAWNDWDNCVVRIKLDCAHYETPEVMVITDWKTGKHDERRQTEYLEQLELYALAALVLHPHIKEAKPRLVYTDLGIVEPKEPLVYTQADVPRLKKLWAQRTKPMMTDKKFAPRPNDKCRWCYFGQSGKAKGGPGLCKY